VQRRLDAGAVQQPCQDAAVVQADHEVPEPERRQDLADRAQDLGFHDRRRRSDRVDVALVEFPKPAARWTVGAPHGLNLIALEEARQFVLILRDHASQRHREIVAKRQVGLAARFVLAAFQNLENEFVALFAVLAEQRLDVLERGRLERLEAIAFVHSTNDIDHMPTTPNIVGKKIASTARRLG